MSHFTDIKTQIRDKDVLAAACRELDLAVLENSEARGYIKNKTRGDLVICLKGPYDIAANRQADGTYTLRTDWWDGHVAKEVGENYGRLIKHYGVQTTMREARNRGHMVRCIHKTNGDIAVQITGV